jgi:hypothetical protein
MRVIGFRQGNEIIQFSRVGTYQWELPAVDLSFVDGVSGNGKTN